MMLPPQPRRSSDSETLDKQPDAFLYGRERSRAFKNGPEEMMALVAKDAYDKIVAACRRRGERVCISGLASRHDLAAAFVSAGARYVSTGTDMGFLLDGAMQRAQRARALKI
jgi:endonuclease YncB( thermonuclease family)